MRRRDFIKLGAGLGASSMAAALLPPSPASAQTKTVFKASDVQPPGYPTVAAVASPLAAPWLGPEWYTPEGDHRWMPKRATLRLAGPAANGQKLYLRGYFPADQMHAGPLTVAIAVNGSPLPPANVTVGGDFELTFPLPDSQVGQPALALTVEVSRTFHAGADIRDLGLACSEFEVR